MNRIIKIILIGFVAATLNLAVIAQSQPSRAETQPVVLQALSTEVGIPNLTLGSLVTWSWNFGTYEYVLALGCEGAPTVSPNNGGWQRYILNYRGTEYVYLISDDLQQVLLCNESSLPTAVPSAGQTPLPANPTPAGIAPSTPGAGQGGGIVVTVPSCDLAPRLRVGGTGRVTPGDPNWVHEQPDRTSRKVGEIAGGATFTVLADPVCDAKTGINYWYVQTDDVIGYTAEGLDDIYWIEPVSSTAGFNAQTAGQAAPAAWLSAFPSGAQAIVFSSVQPFMAVLDPNGKVFIYDSITLTFKGQIARDTAATQIAISASGGYMATAHTDGSVYTWETEIQRALGQTLAVGNLTALALNAEGDVLAIADDAGIVWLWNSPLVTPQSQPLAALEVPPGVVSLEFGAASTMLIARDATGKVLAVWQVPGA
jgi:hypothetical protein